MEHNRKLPKCSFGKFSFFSRNLETPEISGSDRNEMPNGTENLPQISVVAENTVPFDRGRG